MKYGRLVFSREFVSPTVCNAGDIVQTLAIDLIYEQMGIPKEDIIGIPMEELGSYSGEKVVLPLDGYFRYSREYPAFPTSSDIIPVFLGVYSTSKQYLKHKSFWQNNGPVGCRDEASFSAMNKMGIEAYLTGCMTVLFPKREEKKERNKVFLVDAYKTVEQFLPTDLLDCVERITHDLPVDSTKDNHTVAIECEETARNLYNRYRDEAKLVVTSRLHCAVPCIAMGIPTIVVKDSYDERFSWLEKLTYLYTEDEFDKIDWYPEPVDFEEHKKIVMDWAISMVKREPDKKKMKAIHDFYMNRERKRISASIMVKGYMWLAQYCPNFANFIRTKVLVRFTITANTKK